MPTITINLEYSLVNETQSGLWLRAAWSLLLEKRIVPKSSGKLASKAALVAEIKKLMFNLPEDCDLYKKLFEENDDSPDNKHTIEYTC